MSKKNGATIYFIDPNSSSFSSVVVMQYELRGAATYLSEAFHKMPYNVEDYLEVPFGQESIFEESINRLKERAAAHKPKS